MIVRRREADDSWFDDRKLAWDNVLTLKEWFMAIEGSQYTVNPGERHAYFEPLRDMPSMRQRPSTVYGRRWCITSSIRRFPDRCVEVRSRLGVDLGY
jgi:hypothetical protein